MFNTKPQNASPAIGEHSSASSGLELVGRVSAAFYAHKMRI